MNNVTVSNLPVGSYISRPVYLDEKYILLSPDIPITEELQKRLLSWGYKAVYTDGTPIAAPPEIGAEFGDAEGGNNSEAALFENTEADKTNWEETHAFYNSMCEFLSTVFDRYATKQELRIDEITDKVKELIQVVKSKKNYILRLNEMSDENHSYLIAHSLKSAILAIVIADTMKMPPFKQIDIGTAALLHEIGMLRIPEKLYMNGNVLTPEQRKTVTAHTVIGFRILKEAQFSMPITRAVLEHHERIDGTGYPRSITGEKTSFYAKIIAVACSYAAIVSNRPHKNAMDGHSGILDLLKNTGKKYDEQVIRTLVYTLSIYPLGTFVLLSNGAKGIVVETDPKTPRHPVVRLLQDEKGDRYRDQPLLRTQEGGEIQIKRPLIEKEIKELKTKI
jgi:HD-GYP domain-containing protein (c-di-GMP phosphodiesterase class II)